MPEMNNFKSGNNIYEVADSKARGISLTWAQYQALSYEEQHNGTAYYITDMDAIYPVDHELNANSRNAVANDIVTPHILAMENVLGAKNVYNYTYLTTQTVGSLTVTVNADKSFSIVGTNDTGADKIFYTNSVAFPVAKGNWVVNGGASESLENDIKAIFYYGADGNTHANQFNEDVPYTFNEENYTNFIVWVKAGATVNVTFKPMIRPAGTDPTYVPYAKTNAELTDDVTVNTNSLYSMMNVNGAKNILPCELAVSDTISGVTFTVNSDGTIIVNGTATEDISYALHANTEILPPNRDCILTGCPSGGSKNTYFLVIGLWTGSHYNTARSDYGSGIAFNSNNGLGVSAGINIKAGTVINNLTFKPMIRDGAIADDTYVPYAMPNRQLTTKQIKRKLVDISGIAITRLDNGMYYASDLISIGAVDHTHIVNVSQVSPWWANLNFIVVNGCGIALVSTASWTVPANQKMLVYYYED